MRSAFAGVREGGSDGGVGEEGPRGRPQTTPWGAEAADTLTFALYFILFWFCDLCSKSTETQNPVCQETSIKKRCGYSAFVLLQTFGWYNKVQWLNFELCFQVIHPSHTLICSMCLRTKFRQILMNARLNVDAPSEHALHSYGRNVLRWKGS